MSRAGELRPRRWLAVVAMVVIGTALFLPAAAMAEGGNSIATAPSVVYGQPEFGNTATGQELEGQFCRYRSYWSLPVTAGDLVTVDWEGTPGTEIKLMPLGTTDYTLFQTEPAVSEGLPSNNKDQVTYNVPVSGAMPLYFRSCPISSDWGEGRPGPYSFIVTAQHGLSVNLLPREHVRTNSVIYGSAALASGAPVPDGMSFTLTASWPHGSATYNATSSGGSLAFTLALPEEAEGQQATLALSRPADSEYVAPKTAEIQTQVAKAAAPPAPVKTRRKHHRRRHHHRHHYRHHTRHWH